MFGLNTYISLFLAVALLLAVVAGLPRLRRYAEQRRQDHTPDAVPPLNMVRKVPDSGPRTRT